MIDAVIRNLIKFIKILPAVITLLNILEDRHMHRGNTVYAHTGWCKKKKKPNAEKFSINP